MSVRLRGLKDSSFMFNRIVGPGATLEMSDLDNCDVGYIQVIDTNRVDVAQLTAPATPAAPKAPGAPLGKVPLSPAIRRALADPTKMVNQKAKK